MDTHLVSSQPKSMRDCARYVLHSCLHDDTGQGRRSMVPLIASAVWFAAWPLGLLFVAVTLL